MCFKISSDSSFNEDFRPSSFRNFDKSNLGFVVDVDWDIIRRELRAKLGDSWLSRTAIFASLDGVVDGGVSGVSSPKSPGVKTLWVEEVTDK